MKDAVYYQIELTLHNGAWYASSRAWDSEGDDVLAHGRWNPDEGMLETECPCVERMIAWTGVFHKHEHL